MSDNKKGLEALKNLLNFNEYLNEEYVREFGEESPYKADDKTEDFLREIIKKSEENKEK